MKNFKKVLALVLVLATLMGFATVAGAAYKDAADISGDYTEAVKVLELIETMEGYPDGTFGPKKTITREEAAKLIAIFDNKDSDISTYYTSINPFADEKGRWGESYVGYGYRAGIIAGMNATTYAPTANVTGTQFLKMALVTLGYDQEAEGFVGSSWAVNVLALARKLDLIDGLADGWKAEKDLTREEAAQILLNTLKANTVEYAQEAKQVGFKPTATVKNNTDWTYTWKGRIYLTVAGAVSTGKPLYEGFGLKTSTSYDDFMRPYVKWTKNNKSVEVMEAPKATFTTRFSACDLLAELGVEKTDKDTRIAIDDVYNNGILTGKNQVAKDALMNGNGETYTLGVDEDNKPIMYKARPSGVEYHIIDAAKFGIWSHENSTCARPSAAKHGAQGTLTQVFYNGKDDDGVKHYYITSIETWLAKVEKVTNKTTSRDEHVKSDGAVTLEEVYTHDLVSNANKGYNFGSYNDGTTATTGETGADSALKAVIDGLKARNKKLTYDDPTGISKGDYVLLTYSLKANKVESLDVVEGKDGRLNGYKYGNAANPSQTRVDGEFIKDSVHFALGYDLSKTNKYGTYTFFYDAYGNVIGMKDSADASGWGVADRMWIGLGEKGAITFNADIVGLDGETKTAQIKKRTDFTIKGEDYAYDVATWLDREYPNGRVNGLSYKDFTQFYDHLYKFSTDSEGNFTWNYAINTATRDDQTPEVRKAGSLKNLDAEIKLSNKKAYMTIKEKNQDAFYVTLTSDTQFLVHNMDGTYDEYTGYKNVPSMIGHYVEYVMDDDNKAAEVVYLTNDVYTTDSKFIAYVGDPADEDVIELNDDGNDYYELTVYVGGEAKTVYVEEDVKNAYFDKGTLDNNNTFHDGFYQFQYLKVDGDEIVRVVKGPKDSTAVDFTGNDKHLKEAVKVEYFNQTVLEVENDDVTYSLAEDCAVYGIRKGKIVETDLAEIENLYPDAVADENNYADKSAHKVFFQFNDDEQVTALYFVLAKND